ncbi:TPA: AmmeMemoRadiSam system protein B [Candidatus Micrarchaeota archaeon]|nr:AmmeMemoRadiSam system protein B [Candidatus Micrarchaeota archaeon]
MENADSARRKFQEYGYKFLEYGYNMKREQEDVILRPPAVAGMFYPDDPEELEDMIKGFVERAKEETIPGTLRGLVVPHAGYIYSGTIAAVGYKLLAQYAKHAKNIFLFGPSHHSYFNGLAESGMNVWETPLGRVNANQAPENLKKSKLVSLNPAAHAPEHCLEVQLPFLQTILGRNSFSVIPLLTGDVSASTVANAIEDDFDKGSDSFFIASSDLSHYNPYQRAVELDGIANKAVPALDILTMQARGDACGKSAILILMYLAKLKGWKGKFLEYKNSGDTAGDKMRVVGYGCYAFYSSEGD